MRWWLLVVALCNAAPDGETKACRPFVMISMQRSGSRYVTSTLSTHPEVYSGGELFMNRLRPEAGDAMIRASWDDMEAEIASSLGAFCGKRRAVRVVGFKWMTNQGHDAHHARARAYLASANFRVIYLWRRNVLRQFISNFLNKRSEHLAHPKTKKQIQAAAALAFELPTGAKLLHALEAAEVKRSRIEAYYGGLPSTRVFYEDLVAAAPSYNATWARVTAFLGVSDFTFSAANSVVLHANGPALDAVLNKDAVRATLYRACANHYECRHVEKFSRPCANATEPVGASLLEICRGLRRDEVDEHARAPPKKRRAPGRAGGGPRADTV